MTRSRKHLVRGITAEEIQTETEKQFDRLRAVDVYEVRRRVDTNPDEKRGAFWYVYEGQRYTVVYETLTPETSDLLELRRLAALTIMANDFERHVKE